MPDRSTRMDDHARPAAPRVVARTVLIAVAIIGLAHLLWIGRNILFVLFFGLLVAVLLSVATGWVQRLGAPRIPALIAVLVTVAGLTVGFWVLLWPTISDQLTTVGQDVPRAAQQIGDWARDQYGKVIGGVGDPGPELEERVRTTFTEQIGTILGGTLPIINTAVGALAGVLVVLVVGIYTAARPRLYREGFVRLIPPAHRDRVDTALDRSDHALQKWMVGTLINMILVGLLTLTGLWILGVPAAIALALIAALFEFVPIIGPIAAAVPAIAVALTVSPTTALWVTLLYVVIQQIEGNVITPLVMRGAADLPPALTVIFQSIMAVVFGFLGLLLAVPLLAVVMVLAKTLYIEPMEGRASPG
jgi:predicted PurR-regulated permease PerM